MDVLRTMSEFSAKGRPPGSRVPFNISDAANVCAQRNERKLEPLACCMPEMRNAASPQHRSRAGDGAKHASLSQVNAIFLVLGADVIQKNRCPVKASMQF